MPPTPPASCSTITKEEEDLDEDLDDEEEDSSIVSNGSKVIGVSLKKQRKSLDLSRSVSPSASPPPLVINSEAEEEDTEEESIEG